jgi:hypothetical protein
MLRHCITDCVDRGAIAFPEIQAISIKIGNFGVFCNGREARGRFRRKP